MSTAEYISSNEMKYNKKKNNFHYASDVVCIFCTSISKHLLLGRKAHYKSLVNTLQNCIYPD